MGAILWLVMGLACVNASPVESDKPEITPQLLDGLLNEEKYEEFASLMGVPVSLVKERDTEGRAELTRHEAMFNKELEGGDYMFDPELSEMGRQALNYRKWPGNKWPHTGERYEIPYQLANHFNEAERNTILGAISRWNHYLGACIAIVPRDRGQENWVYVHSGNGCWSYISRVNRKPQELSLQRNGCLSNGTILHEFAHAAGFTHEHNRIDRNDWVEVLWHNIPDDWKSQYEQIKADDWVDVRRYDYYSVMHYGMYAPGTNRKAFRILRNDLNGNRVNENRVGNGNDFTNEDLWKLWVHYGC